MEGGQRWCQIERPNNPSVHGCFAGKYLQEAKSDGGEVEYVLTRVNQRGEMHEESPHIVVAGGEPSLSEQCWA